MVNIARGQRAAERLMITPCRIRRVTGITVDPETGQDVPAYADPDPYTGTCKLQQRNLLATDEQVPGATLTVLRSEVHVPVAAGPFQIGDIVQILDGATVVRTLRVTGLHRTTFQTAQRLPVEENT